MTSTERGRSLMPLLRDMAADLSVIDELVDAARARSPEVARLPAAENRRHIAVVLAAALNSFERLEDPSEHDFAEATRLGAERAAQGIPIASLLSGVQAGRTRVLEIAIDRGRAVGIPDHVLLEGMLELDRYASALERHVIDGYHAAKQELARTRRDAQAGLLRRLLLGVPSEPRPAELAKFGVRVDGRYHCLVSDVTEPARVRALEEHLATYGGILGTVEGRLAGLSVRPPSGCLPDAEMLLVFAPAGPLGQARASYGLCVAALQGAVQFGRRGPHGVADLVGETALAAQPRLASLLSTALLGALDPTNEFHRELASTALTYLDQGQRLDHTATALHVHPNTVRYRLRRLHELTGMPSVPAEVEGQLTVLQTMRWWWALHTWLRR